MLSYSYTVDSLSQSQDIASAILASTTPSQISATCASIDSFLHSHSPDQSRHFFSFTFPTLICKLFGFDDATSLPPPTPPLKPQLPQSNGWIELASQSNHPDLFAKIFSLLSSNGTLINSISAVDQHSLVKYAFAVERLPEWVRFMLSNEKDCRILSDLCPLFKGKVKQDSIKGSSCQIQLSVFEYYLFWFAYYPVCNGNSENLGSNSVKRSKKFRLVNWAHSIRGFSGSNKREMEQKFEGNLYMQLLHAYLRAFVPIFDLGAHQPYRSSILNYSLNCDGSVIFRAKFLVNAFVHYWLVDNDFSPLPVNVFKSFGVSLPFRSVLGETPPTSGLGEVVKLFVKYLNLSSVLSTDGFDNIEYSGSPSWRVSGGYSGKSRDVVSVSSSACFVGSWNSWIQRPLYRFILRTFLFCTMRTTIKNASQVFSVWVSYMEPWTINFDDFSELDAIVNGSSKEVRKQEPQSQVSGYSPLWQGYVLSNYLYYSSLLMHFIGFAHKFLHTDPEVIVQMVLKVISLLTSSKELIDLIKNVDTVFHSKQVVSSKSTLNSLYKFVPSIHEQLQDWEDGFCESNADGSFLHENWNKDLQLFSAGEDGGQQLLQLFILRAEAELQAISGDNLAHSLQLIDSLKAKVDYLFGGSMVKPIPFSPEMRQPLHFRDEIFKPRRVGNKTLANITYKGDWMNRPISNEEVAWFAKLLIWLSSWLNESLGLNRPGNSDEGSRWSYVDAPGDAANVNELGETMKNLVCLIGSWLLMMGTMTTRLMRKHGLRVNLRVLASKKVVMLLLLSVVFSLLKKAFGLFHR